MLKRKQYLCCLVGLALLGTVAGFEAVHAQGYSAEGDLTVGGAVDRGGAASAAESAASPASSAGPGTAAPSASGQTGASPEPSSEGDGPRITYKEGRRVGTPSRIYDAVDGSMIVNDVRVYPFRAKRSEAVRKYDNGTHHDEVARDGLPSQVKVNDTDYMGYRTMSNYDELKGILFKVAAHPDGAMRFFDMPMVSLEWDGREAPWNPEQNTDIGVYRLTSLEKRMYAFIMQRSQDIIRAHQTPEGKDLAYMEDTVHLPSGLQAERSLRAADNWRAAVISGAKLMVEKDMTKTLAGTTIADASWFPNSYARRLPTYTQQQLQLLQQSSVLNMGIGGMGMMGGGSRNRGLLGNAFGGGMPSVPGGYSVSAPSRMGGAIGLGY